MLLLVQHFTHENKVLSSLDEEVSSCYVPVHMSLADLTTIPDCRILAPRRMVDRSEQERW